MKKREIKASKWQQSRQNKILGEQVCSTKNEKKIQHEDDDENEKNATSTTKKIKHATKTKSKIYIQIGNQW